jgi:hypothetical protein
MGKAACRGIGRAELEAVFQQRLLEPQIEANAGLGFQIGVGEKIERREVLKQLRQGRRLEAESASKGDVRAAAKGVPLTR